MAERTTKVNLVANTRGYDDPIKASAKVTLDLALAQKQEAAAAKAAAVETVSAAQKISIAEKQKALTAAEAAAKEAAGDEAIVASKKEVATAAKALETQEAASAKAVAAAQREAAASGQEVVAAQKAIDDQTKKTGESYVNTGKRMAVAGAALIGVFALAEKATSSFDAAMSGVAAVGGRDAVARMGQLSGAALQAGKDTAYTATQATQAEGELVKAGVSVTDTLNGGLKGALSLAAAGQLDLAQAATIDANALNVFHLKGDQASHVADVLAAGANKSAAGVASLGTGLGQTGLVASQLGLDLESTTAVLAAFADRGLEGADAGTSMKTMLERLAAPTGAAADEMKNLGISAYDANGKFAGIVSVAGQLHDRLGSLSEAQRNAALQTIFGSDAIRGATVLYNLGAQGMQGYIDSVNDSGAASRMASVQMDNLGGDLKQLKGSIDVALIQGGSGGNTALRELTQSATAAVNAFSGLPKPLQEVAVGLAGGGGSALLLVGGLVSASTKVGEMRKDLAGLAETATGAKGALGKVGSFLTGPWGIAAAGAAAVIGIFAGKMGEAKIQVADFTTAIKDDGDALGAHTAAAISADLAQKGLYTRLSSLGLTMDEVTKAAMGNAGAMQLVESTINSAAKAADRSHAVLGKGQSAPDNSRAESLMGDLKLIQATSGALHDQQRAEQQTTAATQAYASSANDAASVQARLAQAAKEAAAGAMQRAGASRAAADAAAAEASGARDVTSAVKGSTSAHSGSTKATKDATAATKADEAAARAHASAQKAANTAQLDGAKSAAANAKAQGAAANATDAGSYANSTAAGAAKSATAATKDQTAAQTANTRAANADISASQAAQRAKDADARAAKSHAKAVSDSAAASASDAQAQADAAEAAREAALMHQLGTEALKGWAAAAADTSHSTDILDDSVSAEVDAMKGAQTQANGLKDALDALNGVHISAARAAVDVQDKMANLTAAIHKNGTALDITTQAGRDNMNQILDTADAINRHAEAVTQETGSVYAGNQALQASKDEFDKVLAAAGVSKEAIQRFNDELLAIPATKAVTIDVNTAQALAELRQFKNAAGDLTAIHIGGTTGKAALAGGGRVVGPGTTTSDSIPAQLSRDEYVIKASAAAKIGYANLDRLNFGNGSHALVRPQFVGSVGGTTPHAGAAAAGSSWQLVAGPGGDSAVATMINYLIRNNLIQAVKA